MAITIKTYNGTSWDDENVKTKWSLIDDKPSTYPPTVHIHDVSDVSGLGSLALKSSLSPSDIPSLAASKITSGTFATARIPTLAISKISGLQTALDSKMEKASFSLSGTTLTITV